MLDSLAWQESRDRPERFQFQEPGVAITLAGASVVQVVGATVVARSLDKEKPVPPVRHPARRIRKADLESPLHHLRPDQNRPVAPGDGALVDVGIRPERDRTVGEGGAVVVGTGGLGQDGYASGPELRDGPGRQGVFPLSTIPENVPDLDLGTVLGQPDFELLLQRGPRFDVLRQSKAVRYLRHADSGIIRQVRDRWNLGGVPQAMASIEMEGAHARAIECGIGEFGEEVLAGGRGQGENARA